MKTQPTKGRVLTRAPKSLAIQNPKWQGPYRAGYRNQGILIGLVIIRSKAYPLHHEVSNYEDAWLGTALGRWPSNLPHACSALLSEEVWQTVLLPDHIYSSVYTVSAGA